MNTSIFSKAVGTGIGLVAAIILSSAAHAGPGPQYWNSQGKQKVSAPETITPATQLCADAQTVAVTTMKPSWPNGRGPLTEVQVGTKTVCHLCPVTTVEIKNAWANGRGPLTRVEVTKTGVEHTCTNCTVAMK